jgi:hypothetical protein
MRHVAGLGLGAGQRLEYGSMVIGGDGRGMEGQIEVGIGHDNRRSVLAAIEGNSGVEVAN